MRSARTSTAYVSDRDLLEQWARGSNTAAGDLLDRHYDRLYRFFELTAPGAAEDLVQDTLLACLQARHRLRDDASFRAFVLGIARKKTLMFWRGRMRRGQHLDIEGLSLAALQASPSSLLRSKRDARRLLDALRRLSLRAQMILQMYYWDGLTGPELALALDMPEGSVRSRLRRAREALRAAMESDDYEPSTETYGGFDGWAASLRGLA